MNQSQTAELNADATALKIAQRRGYTPIGAAEHLLTAIEAVAEIEGRSGLDFDQLIRCQNLRAIAGLSSVGANKKE
jgi:predicted Zn-dependent protease